jgi:acetyl-CoA carboxylase biotin carboxylase subunit
MAKIIAHAQDRPTALLRMQGAIAATRVTGVATNLPFHALVLREPRFRAGAVDTEFVAQLLERDAVRTEGAIRG